MFLEEVSDPDSVKPLKGRCVVRKASFRPAESDTFSATHFFHNICYAGRFVLPTLKTEIALTMSTSFRTFAYQSISRFTTAPFLMFSAVLLMLSARVHGGEPIRLAVTQDNSIVMVDGEWNENAGEQSRMRIKGNQHIVAMAFDVSSVSGKLVKRATLVCTQSEQTISGVTLSTIATPWSETKSTGLTAGVAGIVDWGYSGARFPAVSGGNSFTLTHRSEPELFNGEYHFDVPPDFVHAMSIGIAHGIAIHEHDADYKRNPTIYSREQSSKKPYLLVELDDEKDSSPEMVSDLSLSGVDQASPMLTFTPPPHGFAYDVLVDGLPLGRHNIPPVVIQPVDSREKQSIMLRDLPDSIKSDDSHQVDVVTLNRTGLRSRVASVRAVLIKSQAVPKPQISIPDTVASPIRDVAVIPSTDKFDAEGKPVGDLPDGYRTRNAIYNGERIHLVAAAGEVVGFQVLLKGNGAVSVNATISKLEPRIDLYEALYVNANGRSIPDPLVPMPKQLKLRTDRDTNVLADVFVPFDAKAGQYRGSLGVSDGRVIPIEIEVLPFVIPKQATFFCEMNSYGLPDHVADYYEHQRVAYDHRVHANILHYSHNTAAPGTRKSNLDMRLESGRRMDNKRYDNFAPGATNAYWDDFVDAFGSFIDGSCFKDGHRGAIAAPGFYLTFHESWPLNCREYFNGNLDAYQAFNDKPLYAETYVNILSDFTRLAKTKGWNETGFQVYFNNKGSLNELTKAPWILDEPSSFWDYRALQYYGELTDRGRASSPDIHVSYRVDISRPEYCRGQLNKRDDLWVVSSSAFKDYRRLVTDRIQRDGLSAWVYGTSNHVHESNRNIQAWILDAWHCGATGIVPWQTVDKSGNALKEADQLGLFIYDERPSGEIVIRHSIRLKAYREAQQLVEYLNILKTRRGWSEEQMRRFVSQYVQLTSEVKKVNEADAGTSGYASLSPASLDSLKLAVAELISR